MKNQLILLAALVFGFQLQAQGGAGEGNFTGPTAEQLTTVLQSQAGWSKIVGVNYDFDDIRFANVPTDGSFYLFDNWNNESYAVVGDKKYVFNNLNFHMEREEFISKLEDKSFFVLDFNSIDYVLVNGRKFISNYDVASGQNKVYEIINEGEDYSLLKRYDVAVQEYDPNPMLNRNKRRIKQKVSYAYMRNGGVLPLKLKKSEVLKIVEVSKRDALEKYAKQQGLSFKKEADVAQMMNYLKSI